MGRNAFFTHGESPKLNLAAILSMPERRKRGRPPVDDATAEKRRELLVAVRLKYIKPETACELEGIAPRTLRLWQKQLGIPGPTRHN